MKTKTFFLLIFLLVQNTLQAQVEGRIDTIPHFESQYIYARDIYVWLPDTYDQQQSYAVLYMYDAQMLFDASNTWNHQEWGVDEHMNTIAKDSSYIPTIVVGIPNGDHLRHSEYFPQKPFEKLKKEYQDSLYSVKKDSHNLLFAEPVQSDNYLKFMVEELKPYIDAQYSTHTEKEYTFVMGSSMGGLMSLYAICEYPDIFGGAACLSTHWPGAFNPIDNRIPNAFFQYMEYFLPCSADHKIYFDYGTETLDEWYEPWQLQADEVMRNAGFSKKSWETKKYEKAAHDETSWNKRLRVPLSFLLRK
jgi:esterase/lipase superfamily enzyme